MKLSASCLTLALSLCVATSVHASTLTGAVYTGIPVLSYAGTPIPSHTGSATFNVNGVGINYASGPSAYTPAGFLNNPGFSNIMGTFSSTADLDNTEVVISGSLSVKAGDQFSILHDDGVVLYLNGVKVIDSAMPTTAKTSAYTTVASDAGMDTFTLYYVETGGRPADLIFTDNNLVVGATPEPSSLILLGTGLATAAGFARRRFTRPV